MQLHSSLLACVVAAEPSSGHDGAAAVHHGALDRKWTLRLYIRLCQQVSEQSGPVASGQNQARYRRQELLGALVRLTYSLVPYVVYQAWHPCVYHLHQRSNVDKCGR